WLDACQWLGFDVGFFQLSQGGKHFHLDADGNGPAVGPVFTDTASGQEVLIMSAVPGLRSAILAVDADNRLWGIELNARHRLAGLPFLDHVDLLAGFRYLSFEENLDVSGESTAIPGGHLPLCG